MVARIIAYRFTDILELPIAPWCITQFRASVHRLLSFRVFGSARIESYMPLVDQICVHEMKGGIESDNATPISIIGQPVLQSLGQGDILLEFGVTSLGVRAHHRVNTASASKGTACAGSRP